MLPNSYRKRRLIFMVLLFVSLFFTIISNTPYFANISKTIESKKAVNSSSVAINVLNKLQIKNRDTNTNYSREQFGGEWVKIKGCDTRNIILNRDLENAVIDNNCNVTSGLLKDPYTGKVIKFKRGSDTSAEVQIDHVVALNDAWQTGAQLLTADERKNLANDPLELLAVDGDINAQKSSGDSATWLPPNKAFRCQYVSRQIAVKIKYKLWVTQSEYKAMKDVLKSCPDQLLPNP